MKQVTWTAVVSRDLRDAELYLAQFHPNIGRDLVIRAVEPARYLLVNPGLGAPVGRSRWRKWRIKRTRYLLLYRPTAAGIEIGRVRYDRSNWQLVPE